MSSLTHYLDIAKKKEKDYFGTDKVQFNTFSPIEVINPYPSSLGERKLWGLMGTFTDYMMRKLFRDHLVSPDANVISERHLIAQVVQENLPLLVTDSPYINESSIYEIDDNGASWIDSHLNDPWDRCIVSSFRMSQMDALYRAGKISDIKELSRAEEEGIKGFLGNVLDWLKRDFGNVEFVVLNPLLGHPDVCAADGDIVIDNTLFDIKTVKKPHEQIRKNKDQLLGYVALDHYHTTHPIDTSQDLGQVTTTGFLFPQSLATYTTSLDNYSNEDKDWFIFRLRQLKEHQTKVASIRQADRIKKNLPKDMEFSAIVDMIRTKEIPTSINYSLARFNLLMRRGKKYSDTDRPIEAESAFRSAIQLTPIPLSFVPLMKLLDVLVREGKFNVAEEEIVGALEEILFLKEKGKKKTDIKARLIGTNINQIEQDLNERLEMVRKKLRY